MEHTMQYQNSIDLSEFEKKTALFSQEVKLAFKVSFLCGFFTHLAFMIYQVGNGDAAVYSIVQTGGYIFDRQLGRWFTPYVAAWRNDITMPVFITLVTLVILSAAVALVVDIFIGKPLDNYALFSSFCHATMLFHDHHIVFLLRYVHNGDFSCGIGGVDVDSRPKPVAFCRERGGGYAFTGVISKPYCFNSRYLSVLFHT